jgi:hypothetical protein
MPSVLRRLFGWLFRADPDRPAPPAPSDPERDKYRASDPSTRVAATCYADPLGRIIDAWSDTIPGPVEQLAEDLSGRYGPYTVKWKGTFRTKWEFGFDSGKYVLLDGQIFDDDDNLVGICTRKFYRDDKRRLVVDNDRLELIKPAQRRGFATALYDGLEAYYRRSGVEIMTVHATDVGGYTWALRDFKWDPNSPSLSLSLDHIRRRIEGLIAHPDTHPADRLLLQQICDRIRIDDPGTGCPTPKELAELRGVDTELGYKVMKGIDWYGVYRLSA